MLVWGSDPSSWIKEVAGESGQGDAKMGGDGENEDEAERCKLGSLRKGTTFFPSRKPPSEVQKWHIPRNPLLVHYIAP